MRKSIVVGFQRSWPCALIRSWRLACMATVLAAACAPRVARGSEPLPPIKPVEELVQNYLEYRRAVFKATPPVVLCDAFLADAKARALIAAAVAPSIAVDRACPSFVAMQLSPAGTLLVRKVEVRNDTATVTAEFFQKDYPRSWIERYIYFRAGWSWDWCISVGQFAAISD